MLKYNCLNKSELTYELAIRGITPKSTVQGLRSQLGDPAFVSDPIDIPTCFSIEEDLGGCELSLVSVDEGLQRLAKQYSEAFYGRLSALLAHLDHRFARIEISEVKEDSHTQEWYDRVDTSIRKAQSTLLALQSRPPVPSSCQDNTTRDIPNNTPISVNVTCQGTSRLDLRGITFDGRSCVRSFLRKAEMLMASRSITSEQMLRAIPDIFRGEALSVLLAEQFQTWEELTVHLREVFERPDYDFDLRAEIMARTQGIGETISVYISVMRNYFKLLKKPMPEEDQLEIVSRNLHPSYLPGLGGGPVLDLADLQSRCKQYESRLWRSRGYVHPPTKPTPMLVPELSYAVLHGPSAASATSSSYYNNLPPFADPSGEAHTFNGQLPHNPRPTHKPLVCFRCNKPGFTTKNCDSCNVMDDSHNPHIPDTRNNNNFKSKTSIICFKCKSPTHTANNCRSKCYDCGRQGVTRLSCPQCAPNKRKNVDSNLDNSKASNNNNNSNKSNPKN